MDANRIATFPRVSRELHPNDEMFLIAKAQMPEPGKAFHYYFYSGGHVATKMADLAAAHGIRPAESSILDFACGYGRVARYFKILFREVWGSDLEPEMTSFISEKFGLRTFQSQPDPAAVVFPEQQFDIVFSFSLFTHLPPDEWPKWFFTLAQRVRPGGLFVITTRGVEFAQRTGETMAEDVEIQFSNRNETRGRLDTKAYGQTTVRRSFVMAVAESRPDLVTPIAYFSTGEFDLYQDVHVFQVPAHGACGRGSSSPRRSRTGRA